MRCSSWWECGRSANDESWQLTLVGTLAWVLLAECGHAAFQADALTATTGADWHTWHLCRTGGALAVRFGNDLVAHDWLLREKNQQNSLLGHI